MNYFSQSLFTDTTMPVVDEIIEYNHQVSILIIILIIISIFVARIITKQVMYLIVGRVLESQHYTNKKEENKRKNTLVSALNTIATVLYVIIGVIAIFYEIGVNFSALIATFGALGVVLGIAGQSAIKDFIRGMSILFYDQMRVDDIVELSGKTGRVEYISLQVVRLRNLDGDVHVIPNGDIGVVTNKTNSFSNINMNVLIAYDNDINTVEEVSNKIGAELAEDPDWKDKIINPIKFLRVNDFGDVSLEIKYMGRVLPGEQWQVAGEFRRRLKLAFDKNNIKVPYPQRVVHESKSKK